MLKYSPVYNYEITSFLNNEYIKINYNKQAKISKSENGHSNMATRQDDNAKIGASKRPRRNVLNTTLCSIWHDDVH